MIVTAEDIPLYAEPKDESEVIEKISWDVVELVGVIEPDRDFQNVKTRSGKTGYVATRKLRSLIDYRLFANEVEGKWQITAFVAGD